MKRNATTKESEKGTEPAWKSRLGIGWNWWPVIPAVVSIVLAVILYFLIPARSIAPPNEIDQTVNAISQLVMPIVEDSRNSFRLAMSLMSVSLGTLISLMGVVLQTRYRFSRLERSFDKDLPDNVEERIFKSLGFALASRHEEIKEQIVKILNSYDAAIARGTSRQLLDYATEGLRNVADMMKALPDGKVTFYNSPSFYLEAWRRRLLSAPKGTVVVATSRVDKKWWEQNRPWLDFNCEMMDKSDFVWIRIFIFRSEQHRDELKNEMDTHAKRGIKVFSLMEDSVRDVRFRDFRDTMLIGVSIDGLGDSQTARMQISGGGLVGINTFPSAERGDITGLQMLENENDLQESRELLNAWLQASMRVQADWHVGFFDARYPDIASFKEKHSREEANGIDLLIKKKFGLKTKLPRILDVACAHGRIALQLAKRGYKDILGIDLCELLIKRAREEATKQGLTESVTFDVCDINTFKPIAKFDVAISVFNSFGYYETDEANHKFLGSVQSVLNDGGIFILDVDDKEYFLRHRRGKTEPAPGSPWEWGTMNLRVECRHSFEELTKRRRSRFILSHNSKHEEMPLVSVRLYDEGELRAILEDSFRVLNVYSDFTFRRRYVSGSTEHMIFVASKK